MMTDEKREKVENCLVDLIERCAKTATTAAEVEALAAVVLALTELERY